MHVIKLGGSLLECPEVLRDWLQAIMVAGPGRVVVVPGGGRFADAVRRAQIDLGFDDRAAHRMALLTMEQCGVLLAALERSLVPSDSFAAIGQALRAGRIPLWMPYCCASNAGDIPASWDVTSDSLAAWLAHKLAASALWLVKSCSIPVETPVRLVARGIVDAAFPHFCAHASFAVHVLGPGERFRLTAGLNAETLTTAPTAMP